MKLGVVLTPVKLKAKIVIDNSGIASELPVIVTEQGVLDPLLCYLLHHQHDRSSPWSEKVVHATYLLMQYMEANQDCFSDPGQLFESFVQRLYTGTIGDDGFDYSGLYWFPMTTKTANTYINSLTGLTDYLANNQGVQSINPLCEASSFDKRLNYAAWFRRNQHDFLGHIKRQGVSNTITEARNIRGRRAVVSVHDDVIGFPERLFENFFRFGMGGSKDERVSVRNQLILLMMHFAGCRESDCLHLWVQDVYVDPANSDGVIVRLYHPEEGLAPDGWRGRNGITNRAAYLREQYALTPRNRLTGTKRVGWKYNVADHKDNYIQLQWFPQQASILFAQLWHRYIHYLAAIDRHHPYAFVSFDPQSLGQPLTINAFKDAYKKALYRIAETPSKINGRSPHAHRHALGRRLAQAGVHPRIIQKTLHHKSLASQEPYTAPGITQVTEVLNQAYAFLEEKAEIGKALLPVSNWSELLLHGFEDIDPDGLLSGPYPKFKEKY